MKISKLPKKILAPEERFLSRVPLGPRKEQAQPDGIREQYTEQ
jgi:hypothetical protein